MVIVQENHTFDSYFGHYCTAPIHSNPDCTAGPRCCEAAPDTEPSGAAPVTLDDREHGARDPDHTKACEAAELHDGAMDRFVTGSFCSSPENFAIAPPALMAVYFDYASRYALADRYFQPMVGQSSANDMYFAVAKYVFTDNDFKPDAAGHTCNFPSLANPTPVRYQAQTTIADVVRAAGHSFAFYAQGYGRMRAAVAMGNCPPAPADCTWAPKLATAPCDYDPSDVPFQYYDQLTDSPAVMKDFDADFPSYPARPGPLPDVAFVKALQYHNEHPGYGTTITNGESFVKQLVNGILGPSSPYRENTLVLVTWDEGGGYFDHIPPPPASAVDGQAYGTRVPLLAIGRFARANTVSHAEMEHASIVRFLELNFTGQTGQLRARDAVVNGIGSLLDQTATGGFIPN